MLYDDKDRRYYRYKHSYHDEIERNQSEINHSRSLSKPFVPSRLNYVDELKGIMWFFFNFLGHFSFDWYLLILYYSNPYTYLLTSISHSIHSFHNNNNYQPHSTNKLFNSKILPITTFLCSTVSQNPNPPYHHALSANTSTTHTIEYRKSFQNVDIPFAKNASTHPFKSRLTAKCSSVSNVIPKRW